MKAQETLKIAASLVSGDRAKKHGDMFHSHDLIAKLWSVYLFCFLKTVLFMSDEITEKIEYWENGMAKKEYHHKNEKLEELATKIQELLFKF